MDPSVSPHLGGGLGTVPQIWFLMANSQLIAYGTAQSAQSILASV